jgi:hypothetical protein
LRQDAITALWCRRVDGPGTITARGETVVIVRTPQPAGLVKILAGQDLDAEVTGERVVIRGTTTTTVSQIAFDNRIRVVELTALTRAQDVLVFGGYTAAALLIGTVLLYRRDTN